MIVYHVTTPEKAAAIEHCGFRDGSGAFMLEGIELAGVVVNDRPLPAATLNQGKRTRVEWPECQAIAA